MEGIIDQICLSSAARYGREMLLSLELYVKGLSLAETYQLHNQSVARLMLPVRSLFVIPGSSSSRKLDQDMEKSFYAAHASFEKTYNTLASIVSRQSRGNVSSLCTCCSLDLAFIGIYSAYSSCAMAAGILRPAGVLDIPADPANLRMSELAELERKDLDEMTKAARWKSR